MARATSQFYSEPPAAAQAGELDLAGAARLAGLEQEVVLLRALVKRAVQQDQAAEARRLVQALGSLLRLQRALAGEADDELREALEAVLEAPPRAAAVEAGAEAAR